MNKIDHFKVITELRYLLLCVAQSKEKCSTKQAAFLKISRSTYHMMVTRFLMEGRSFEEAESPDLLDRIKDLMNSSLMAVGNNKKYTWARGQILHDDASDKDVILFDLFNKDKLNEIHGERGSNQTPHFG